MDRLRLPVMELTICRLGRVASISEGPDEHTWNEVEATGLESFFEQSSDHRPRTVVRVLHDDDRIYFRFQVEDRYVRAVSARYHDSVWCDSCVEFFVQPRVDAGYFNFEFSANGQFLVSYITDPARVPGGFEEFVKVPWELAKDVRVRSSLGPGVIDPEITVPVTWTLDGTIPVALLEQYAGPLRPLCGTTWRGNFYKCGDKTSHPHWAAWSPIESGANFHQPHYFGRLNFV